MPPALSRLENTVWATLSQICCQLYSTSTDVRLDDYRNEDGQMTADQRSPVGVALSDIWVPFRLDGKDQALEIAFAESPLPAARINRLQSVFNLRYYRCQQIKRLLPHPIAFDGAMVGVTPNDRPVFYLDGPI